MRSMALTPCWMSEDTQPSDRTGKVRMPTIAANCSSSPMVRVPRITAPPPSRRSSSVARPYRNCSSGHSTPRVRASPTLATM